jgi:uncharacterized protein YndB with AHSA1/START domain
MGVIEVTAERTVNAPAEAVYGHIRDMHTHPKFLPPAFSDFHIESGGVGTGSVTRFKVTAGGRTREYHMTVDEPEPGRVLRESDQSSSLITKFIVDPAVSGSSLVQISTTWRGAGGIGGFFERTFAPRAMKAIYEDELARLDAYVHEQQTA